MLVIDIFGQRKRSTDIEENVYNYFLSKRSQAATGGTETKADFHSTTKDLIEVFLKYIKINQMDISFT